MQHGTSTFWILPENSLRKKSKVTMVGCERMDLNFHCLLPETRIQHNGLSHPFRVTHFRGRDCSMGHKVIKESHLVSSFYP